MNNEITIVDGPDSPQYEPENESFEDFQKRYDIYAMWKCIKYANEETIKEFWEMSDSYDY